MPRKRYDWKAIQDYHDQGHGFVECRKRFGFTHTAWVKAIKRGELDAGPREFADRRRRYDWSEIQAYYDEGHSYLETQMTFGFGAQAWQRAKRRREISPRTSNGMPLEELLRGRRGRQHVKSRLLRAGLLENRCSACGLTEWRGRTLVMHLDHVNGIKDDHRLENLRMLCPNCHSQTETYGGKNMKRLRALHEERQGV